MIIPNIPSFDIGEFSNVETGLSLEVIDNIIPDFPTFVRDKNKIGTIRLDNQWLENYLNEIPERYKKSVITDFANNKREYFLAIFAFKYVYDPYWEFLNKMTGNYPYEENGHLLNTEETLMTINNYIEWMERIRISKMLVNYKSGIKHILGIESIPKCMIEFKMISLG